MERRLRITPTGALTTLYSFCSGTCVDGAFPYAGLVQAGGRELLRDNAECGGHDRGTVFEMTPAGTLTTLYSFCAQNGCSDGCVPLGRPSASRRRELLRNDQYWWDPGRWYGLQAVGEQLHLVSVHQWRQWRRDRSQHGRRYQLSGFVQQSVSSQYPSHPHCQCSSGLDLCGLERL